MILGAGKVEKYCVLCEMVRDVADQKCCTEASLVFSKTAGLLGRQRRFYDAEDNELSPAQIEELRRTEQRRLKERVARKKAEKLKHREVVRERTEARKAEIAARRAVPVSVAVADHAMDREQSPDADVENETPVQELFETDHESEHRLTPEGLLAQGEACAIQMLDRLSSTLSVEEAQVMAADPNEHQQKVEEVQRKTFAFTARLLMRIRQEFGLTPQMEEVLFEGFRNQLISSGVGKESADFILQNVRNECRSAHHRPPTSNGASNGSAVTACQMCGAAFGKLMSINMQQGGYRCILCGTSSCAPCCHKKGRQAGRSAMLCPRCGSDRVRVFVAGR